MKKKGSILSFLIPLLAIIVATIIIFVKEYFLLGFLVCYEAFILLFVIRFGKSFFCTGIYLSFQRFYLKNEWSMLLVTFTWIFVEFFTVIAFLMLNYILDVFLILSIIQLILDFILTFEIIPSIIVEIFKE